MKTIIIQDEDSMDTISRLSDIITGGRVWMPS